MKFQISLLVLIFSLKTAFTSPVTPTSTKSILKGPGRILDTHFTSSGTPIIYNNFGEILEATPTDFFSEYKLKYGPITGLADKDCRFGKNYRWNTNPAGKHQGKRIGHFMSLSQVFLTLEVEDFQPALLSSTNLTGSVDLMNAEILLVNSGDPKRVLVYRGFQLYYFVHDFVNEQYFNQPYFSGGPLGTTFFHPFSVTGVQPEDNESGRYFMLTNSIVFSYREGTYVNQITLPGTNNSQAFLNLAMKYDKITKFLFVKGKFNIWLLSWNTGTETFASLNTYPEMTNDRDGQIYYFDHPTDSNKWIILNHYGTYLQIYHFDKVSQEMINTQKILKMGYNTANCHIELLDPLNMLAGFSCEGSLFTASMLTAEHQQTYHIGLSRGILFPINKEKINFLIDGFAVVEYDMKLGLMQPKLPIP